MRLLLVNQRNYTYRIISLNYSDVISTISLIGTAIGIPASAYVSYHYAIKGERRKEWNALADPIMESLIQQLDRASKGIPPWTRINQEQIIPLANISKLQDARAIQSAFEMYEKAHKECGTHTNYGREYDFHSPHILIEAIENLMLFVRHR